MNEPSKTRLSIDLDALERQLQEARGQSSGVSTRAPRSDDPLAELARIVGQDDPFRAILAGDRPRAAQGQVVQEPMRGLARNAPASRHEPRFTHEPRYADEVRYADEPEYGQDHGYANAPAYDAGLAHHKGMAGDDGAPHGQGHPHDHDHSHDHEHHHGQDLAHGQENAHEQGFSHEQEPSQDEFAEPRLHAAMPAHAGRGADDEGAASDGHGHGHGHSFDAHAHDNGHDLLPAAGQDRFARADEHHDAYADRHGMDAGAGESARAPGDDDHHGVAAEARPVPRQRSRKGVYAVGAVLGVAVVGIGLAYGLKGPAGKSVNGEPVTIKADDSPSKVQPQNPGGVEIPNQNKQIYERVGQTAAAESKVVNREEQPLDINQMIRRDASRSILPVADGAPTGDTSPASATSGAAAVALPQPPQATNPGLALGEPKRVKTVSVKPDGSIVSDNAGEAKSVSAASQSPSGPAPKPKPVAATPAASQATTPAAPRSAAAAAPAPSSAPTRTADAQSDDSNATRPNPAGSPLSIAPTGTGATRSIAPARRVATTAAPDDSVNSTASTNAATSPAASSFSVQLAAPASEKEARDTFASLQKKFPADLSSMRPTIRKAEVGDKTIFRLRVGPLSREEATSLCTRLQSSGGACFVAKN